MMRPLPRASIAPPIILVQMKQCVRLRSTKLCQVLEIGVLDGHVEIAATDVVDQDVDRSRLGEHARAKRLAFGRIRTSAAIRPDASTSARATSSATFARASRIAGSQHDVGAGLGQRQRDDAAKAAAPAGYERAFPVETKSIENAHLDPAPVQHGLRNRDYYLINRCGWAVQTKSVADRPGCLDNRHLTSGNEL